MAKGKKPAFKFRGYQLEGRERWYVQPETVFETPNGATVEQSVYAELPLPLQLFNDLVIQSRPTYPVVTGGADVGLLVVGGNFRNYGASLPNTLNYSRFGF